MSVEQKRSSFSSDNFVSTMMSFFGRTRTAQPTMNMLSGYCTKSVLALSLLVSLVHGFSTLTAPRTSPSFHRVVLDRSRQESWRHLHRDRGITVLQASSDDEEICTIQILISDTGGGHRASANALRDAFDVLYPGKISCDIVDIYTDYGPFWPYDDYVNMYKFMAKYPITWDIFYHVGSTDFGICVNAVALETFCFDAFKECLKRPSGNTNKRADMVVSVHPLTQDLPLRILADLDTNGKTRDISARTTPFCTVVTDLGSAHPTWFNKG